MPPIYRLYAICVTITSTPKILPPARWSWSNNSSVKSTCSKSRPSRWSTNEKRSRAGSPKEHGKSTAFSTRVRRAADQFNRSQETKRVVSLNQVNSPTDGYFIVLNLLVPAHRIGKNEDSFGMTAIYEFLGEDFPSRVDGVRMQFGVD